MSTLLDRLGEEWVLRGGTFLEKLSLGTGYFVQGRNGGRGQNFTKQISSKVGTNPRDPGCLVWPQIGERRTESSRENLLCTYSHSPLSRTSVDVWIILNLTYTVLFLFLYTHPCDKLSSITEAQQENIQIASITTLVLWGHY